MNKKMKKSFPDMIISIVLLAFLTSLAVQVPEIPDVSRGYPLVLLIISYIMVLYLLLSSVLKMGKIGYIASTVVFMIASLLYLKLKNKVVMVVLSVVMTIILYFVFTNFLTVILPRGTWFNIAF